MGSMRKGSRVFLAASLCAAFSATSFAGGPFGIIRVGKWQGAAYTTDKGAFSHCTAAAKFDKGRALILAENANRSWIVGAADPAWDFHDRKSVTLILTFDGQAQFEVQGTATREAVVGKLPNQAINAWRKSHQLVATANKQTLQFDLAAAGDVGRRSKIASSRSTRMESPRPAIFPIQGASPRKPRPNPTRPRPTRPRPTRPSPTRPSPTTSLRKSRPIRIGWFQFPAPVLWSAKTRIS
jgi:hypothetical protein